MKRTLVERVAVRMFVNSVGAQGKACITYLRPPWEREARRIIAMVRRHDRKAGKK